MAEWTDICITSYVVKKGTDVMASQYVSYTVQATNTSEGQSHTVERRFNEFVLLQKEIAKEYPGSIMAPLPKDQVFGRFKPAFIESRMRSLEECLRKLYSNKEISISSCWSDFFTSSDFNDSCAQRNATAAGGSTSWLSNVKKMAAPVLVNPGNVLSLFVCLLLLFDSQYLDTSEIDSQVKDIEEYISLHSKLMQKLSRTAGDFTKKSMLSARILKSFSEVCTAIGSDCDDEDDEFIRQFGLSIGSLSLNMSRNADDQMVRVQEPLEQQSRTLLSITSALQRQKSLKKKFIACAADQILCEKAEQKDPTNVSKVESSRNSRALLLTAKNEYLDVSKSLLQNFDTIKESSMYDILAIAEALCDSEVTSCEKQGHVLADLLDELTYDDCDDPS